MNEDLRNIALIAHIDHGKTTLVDCLLQQSGALRQGSSRTERILDTTDQERERGITILSKNTALAWGSYIINIIDTPGHADFGGEVERILSMADSVLLLVDAVEGPMPQTRFVMEKALTQELQPIVVVNKVDRVGARPDWVVDRTFDLFDELGANEDQLDFPVVYCSALEGYAGSSPNVRGGDMTPLFQLVVDQVPPPEVDRNGPLQLQVSALDYDPYAGVIGIGRINRGTAQRNQAITVIDREGTTRKARLGQILAFQGLERIAVEASRAGDLIAFTGIKGLRISDTLCDPEHVAPLPALTVDEPTISMNFRVNKSPFAGREGKYLTSRQIRERLDKELEHNVALRVEPTEDPEELQVSGRGQLHLATLIETMRREGYELAISRPEVLIREIEGIRQEPFEHLTLEVPEDRQGPVMERVAERGGDLANLFPRDSGRIRLDYTIPARGLIGLRNELLAATSGEGLMHRVFAHYGPIKTQEYGRRPHGVLISQSAGKTVEYALSHLQARGALFVGAGEAVYEGQIIGRHVRDNDLTVNPLKGKQLTNVRAAGSDEDLTLTPPERLSLEAALEFIDDDELVEVTPSAIRLRKKGLTEGERKRPTRRAL